MSEQSNVECSVCGLTGIPPKSCDICKGTAQTQSAAHTLSDERSGRAVVPPRYGDSGDTAPRTNDPLWAGAAKH